MLEENQRGNICCSVGLLPKGYCKLLALCRMAATCVVCRHYPLLLYSPFSFLFLSSLHLPFLHSSFLTSPLPFLSLLCSLHSWPRGREPWSVLDMSDRFWQVLQAWPAAGPQERLLIGQQCWRWMKEPRKKWSTWPREEGLFCIFSGLRVPVKTV